MPENYTEEYIKLNKEIAEVAAKLGDKLGEMADLGYTDYKVEAIDPKTKAWVRGSTKPMIGSF